MHLNGYARYRFHRRCFVGQQDKSDDRCKRSSPYQLIMSGCSTVSCPGRLQPRALTIISTAAFEEAYVDIAGKAESVLDAVADEVTTMEPFSQVFAIAGICRHHQAVFNEKRFFKGAPEKLKLWRHVVRRSRALNSATKQADGRGYRTSNGD